MKIHKSFSNSFKRKNLGYKIFIFKTKSSQHDIRDHIEIVKVFLLSLLIKNNAINKLINF